MPLDISQLLGTIEGRQQFGTALVKGLTFQSIARTILQNDLLSQGQMPFYDTNGDRNALPVQECTNNFNFSMMELKRLIDQNSLQTAICKNFTIPQQEDEMLFEHLRQISKQQILYQNEDEMLHKGFIDMMGSLECEGYRSKYLLLHSRMLSYLKVFNGITILRSDLCEVTEAYIIPEAEFAGIFAIRNDLTCIPADNPEMRMLGFVVYEQVAMYVNQQTIKRFDWKYRKYKNKFEYFDKTWKEENEICLA